MLDPELFAHVDYFGATGLIEDSAMLEFLQEDLSDLDEIDKADVELIVKALSAEAQLKSQAAMDAADAEDIKEGRELMGDLGFGCTDCHRFYDEGAGGPDLTGYASREWQIEFIKNPEHKRFYGRDNDNMPIYGPKLDRRGREERPALLGEHVGDERLELGPHGVLQRRSVLGEQVGILGRLFERKVERPTVEPDPLPHELLDLRLRARVVEHPVDLGGEPVLAHELATLRRAKQLGIGIVHVSSTHTRSHARTAAARRSHTLIRVELRTALLLYGTGYT